MKVIRIICPKCSTEEVHKEDISDLHKYSEELVFKRCSECKKNISPEDKLLAAIFGEKM